MGAEQYSGPLDWCDDKYGSYIQREQVEQECPEILPEWDMWLDGNLDPGNYDAFKVIINGHVEWLSETFMPGCIVTKLKVLLSSKIKTKVETEK